MRLMPTGLKPTNSEYNIDNGNSTGSFASVTADPNALTNVKQGLSLIPGSYVPEPPKPLRPHSPTYLILEFYLGFLQFLIYYTKTAVPFS